MPVWPQMHFKWLSLRAAAKNLAHQSRAQREKSKKHFLSTHSHDEKRAACKMHLRRKCMQMLLKMQQLTLQSRHRARRLFFSFSQVANRTPLNTNIYPEERRRQIFRAVCTAESCFPDISWKSNLCNPRLHRLHALTLITVSLGVTASFPLQLSVGISISHGKTTLDLVPV